jgi:hypothetical protein
VLAAALVSSGESFGHFSVGILALQFLDLN